MLQQEIHYPSEEQLETSLVKQKTDLGDMFKKKKEPSDKCSVGINILEQGDCEVVSIQQNTGSATEESPEYNQEKQQQSSVAVNQELQASPASPYEAETQVESNDQLRLLITTVTVRVLSECKFLKNQREQGWIPHTKILINNSIEELAAYENVFPDLKWTKKLCKAVVKDLRKKFGGKILLEHMMLLQDPAVDKAIIQSVTMHVKEFAKREGKPVSSSLWKDFLKSLGCVAGFLTAIVILILIP